MAEFWHSARLPHVESRRSCQDVRCYRPHSHDRFAVGVIDAGTTVFVGATDEPLRLTPGDVVLIPAGHVHACNPDGGRWHYQMIQADPGWLRDLLGPAVWTPLGSAILLIRDPDVHRAFTRANDRLFADDPPDAAVAALRDAFAAAVRAPRVRRIVPVTDPALLARLRPVLDRLRDEPHLPALDELATGVGMDKYRLIRSMKRATGLTPVAWRHNDRVIAARAMLREGRSLAETAHTLGFVDQSHFHRAPGLPRPRGGLAGRLSRLSAIAYKTPPTAVIHPRHRVRAVRGRGRRPLPRPVGSRRRLSC